MAFDARGYYYRSKRENGKVVREYVGAGPAAELIARLDEARRDQRELRAALVRRQLDEARAEYAAVEADLADLDALADLLVRGAMLASGHHRTGRKWRGTTRGRPTSPKQVT